MIIFRDVAYELVYHTQKCHHTTLCNADLYHVIEFVSLPPKWIVLTIVGFDVIRKRNFRHATSRNC